MKYRAFGKTGWSVSEIGFGAWGIGGGLWRGGSDVEAARALNLAVDQGMNFVDTALAYNNGHSERLISNLIRERKERIYVATKVPPMNGKWPARPGAKLKDIFPSQYAKTCTEKSLKNLRIERLDLQQFHVWNDDWAGQDEWKTVVEKLKQEGKVHHFGISINDHQPTNGLEAAESGLIDSFQVIYNIFDQSPEDELFGYCEKKRIAIIARVPFDEGGLTGTVRPETTFQSDDFRNGYFEGDRRAEIYERNNRLKRLLGPDAQTLPELALRFCLSHPAVSVVIPGMRTTSHVEANCSASDGKTILSDLRNELKNHRWVRNFYVSD
jgi:aryl-alcohol dehydrogenase-like predicted oxidoreductase